MKQYWLKFHASGQHWIRVEPHGMVQPIAHNLVEMETRYHMVWFSQLQRLCSKWRIKMVVPTKPHKLAIIFANSEGIWNNYVDIQKKIMQVRFIILLCTWGYNSVVDPIMQHDVWGKLVGPKAILYPCQRLYFEGIQNNYVDIQQKNMQVRITMI